MIKNLYQISIPFLILQLTCVAFTGCSLFDVNSSKHNVFFDNNQKGEYKYYEKLLEIRSADLTTYNPRYAGLTVKDNRTGSIYGMFCRSDLGELRDVSLVAIKSRFRGETYYEVLSVEKDAQKFYDLSVCRSHNLGMERVILDEIDWIDGETDYPGYSKDNPNTGVMYAADQTYNYKQVMGWKCPKCAANYKAILAKQSNLR